MPVPAPLTDAPPPAGRLLEVLASLGRPVTVTASSATSPATTLHLARLLVAGAERHAISAELAMGAGDHDRHDVDAPRTPTTPPPCGLPSNGSPWRTGAPGG
ncbi:MAG: hypothetical protein ACRDOL_28810 [Streptosporangiaceae bacterium]